MRNRILTYVYNLFGERPTIVAGRKSEPASKERPAEGIVLKATPPAPGAAQ